MKLLHLFLPTRRPAEVVLRGVGAEDPSGGVLFRERRTDREERVRVQGKPGLERYRETRHSGRRRKGGDDTTPK